MAPWLVACCRVVTRHLSFLTPLAFPLVRSEEKSLWIPKKGGVPQSSIVIVSPSSPKCLFSQTSVFSNNSGLPLRVRDFWERPVSA